MKEFGSFGRPEPRRNAIMVQKSEFVKLLIASFISQCGSYFLTIALAGFVLAESGSIVKASLVFTLSYLPSIFVGSFLGDWLDRRLSRAVLIYNEVLSIIVSVLCGVSIGLRLPLIFLCALLSLRSILLFIARTGGLRWVKLITPGDQQAARAKLFLLSFFLSTAVAGIMVAQALKQPSIRTVIMVDAATYILSICVLMRLNAIPTSESWSASNRAGLNTINSIREIINHPSLALDFYCVCFSQALFQGAYSVLISYLPIARFHLGVQGIGAFQIAASFGIILGFMTLWVFPDALVGRSMRVTAIVIGGASQIASVYVQPRWVSLLCFFVLTGAFELVWLFSSARFFQNIPAERIGRYQFVMTSSASALMAFCTLIYSVLIEHFGLQIGIIVLLGAGFIVWLYVISRNAERWKTL